METNAEESVHRKQCANQNGGNVYGQDKDYMWLNIHISLYSKRTLYSRPKSPPSERGKKAFCRIFENNHPITTHPLTPFTVWSLLRLLSILFAQFTLSLFSGFSSHPNRPFEPRPTWCCMTIDCFTLRPCAKEQKPCIHVSYRNHKFLSFLKISALRIF